MKKIFEKIILDQCYSPNFCFFIYICFLWENHLELRAQIHRVTCYTNYLCSAWISLKSVNLDRFYKRFFAKISEFGRLTPDCPNGDCRERSEWPYSKDNSSPYPKGLICFSNFPRKMRMGGLSFGSSILGAAFWEQHFVSLSFFCFLTDRYKILYVSKEWCDVSVYLISLT